MCAGLPLLPRRTPAFRRYRRRGRMESPGGAGPKRRTNPARERGALADRLLDRTAASSPARDLAGGANYHYRIIWTGTGLGSCSLPCCYLGRFSDGFRHVCRSSAPRSGRGVPLGSDVWTPQPAEVSTMIVSSQVLLGVRLRFVRCVPSPVRPSTFAGARLASRRGARMTLPGNRR